MRGKTGAMLITLLIAICLSGCSSSDEVHSEEQLFSYKNSPIGDNSAVINIIGQLKHAEEFNEVSLQTKTEPYGMTLTYSALKAPVTEKEYEETAIYNATFLFALIDHAEWVTFEFVDMEDRAFNLTKDELEQWYGQDLSEIASEEELEKLVQEQLADGHDVARLLE
ncbi:DUF4825 domain-containing protein [Virgibacillus xinjiangensis]|uniref:DUF4825 domain-containing protein n=1 Tax=Virgibacillus xinjiangensis TaxID=393090 RepID=A0ABV7CS18_9BACI